MICNDCVYCWKSEDDEYPHCHFEPRAPGELAPCGYDDE